jgi:hypothetical protein
VSSTGSSGQSQGASELCAQAPGLPQAQDVMVSPDGLTVYTLAQAGFDDGQAVDVWRRDPATGRVTQLQCLTANAGQPGCVQAPLDLPTTFTFAAGGKQLVAAGSAITTFPVQPDGTLGAGTCRFKLEADPGNLCDSAPRLAGSRPVWRIDSGSAGTRVYAAGPRDIDSRGQVTALDVAPDGTVSLGACAGDALAGSTCNASRGLAGARDIAVSRDGKGVYTAASHFVVTDEEDGTGHVRTSSIGAFGGALGQLAGTRGCVLFGGTGKNPGCKRSASSRRPGFLEANGVGVSPNGRRVLAGFSTTGAVALLTRNRTTQALSPVGGKGGCVSDGAKSFRHQRVKTCATGHGIQVPNGVAFSPDSRNAYVSTEGGLSAYRVR